MSKKIIAIANQKGGVGKTTTSINLATALAAVGHKTLLIDLDPQGNTTIGVGISKKFASEHNIYKVFTMEKSLKECAWNHDVPNLRIIPSYIDLLATEVEFIQNPNRLHLVKKLIDSFECDFVIIDSPPAMGVLSANALVAATHIIIPMQSEFFALEGLSQLLESIQKIKKKINPGLNVLGILVTMYDKRNKQSQQILKKCKQMFKKVIFETVIPRNAKVSEASSHGMPILLYDMKSKGAESYMKFAREVINRLNGK